MSLDFELIPASAQAGLAPFACHAHASRGRRFTEDEDTSRTVFQRDRDRIIHSGAFRKLQYKTQVFVYHEGDYFRTRLTHSLEVAQIARAISRNLGLNEDLAEAIALAHDLGHTCFGHAGEEALNAAMQPYGGFDHNDETLRVITRLERRYGGFDGLNLTWETVEGVVKHNGPLLPLKDGATLPATTAEENTAWTLELDTFASAEAQVAAMADDIAYNNHDIDDSLRAGLITFADIEDLPLIGPCLAEIRREYGVLEPTRLTHELVRRLINRMVRDVLHESRSRLRALKPASVHDIRHAKAPVIAVSESLRAPERALRDFLFQRVYRHYKVNRMSSKARRVVNDLFTLFLAEPNCLPTDWQHPLSTDPGSLPLRARAVADYIAGMTDRFAILEHRRLFDLTTEL